MEKEYKFNYCEKHHTGSVNSNCPWCEVLSLNAELAIERKALELACEDASYWRYNSGVQPIKPDYFRKLAIFICRKN